MNAQPTAAAAGTVDIGGDLTVNRLGFGAMRITGRGIWGEPPSRDQAIATLRRVVELGVTFFGLFLTPVFYVLLRTLAKRLEKKSPAADAAPQLEGTH